MTAAAILSIITACQTTSPVPPGMYELQQKYLTFDHFKVMAGLVTINRGFAYGWATKKGNVDSAITKALSSCEKGRKKHSFVEQCKIHFLGDRNVRSLSAAELEDAIAQYKNNKNSALFNQGVISKATNNESLSDKAICRFALNSSGGEWDRRVALVNKVRIAESRGLTPEKCFNILGGDS